MFKILTILSVLSIDIAAGLALFSFIRPVTKSRYEEITGTPIEAIESPEREDQSE